VGWYLYTAIGSPGGNVQAEVASPYFSAGRSSVVGAERLRHYGPTYTHNQSIMLDRATNLIVL